MVKIRGPMGSAEASGTFGRSAVFSSWKGRSYAKAHAIPANPRTEAQVASRLMLAYLSKLWKILPPPTRELWNTRAALQSVAPYHAFITHNMRRWSDFRGPTVLPDLPEGGDYPALDVFIAHDGIGQIPIDVAFDNENAGIALYIFHGRTVDFIPRPANLTHLILLAGDLTYAPIYKSQDLGWHFFALSVSTYSGLTLPPFLAGSAQIS